MRYSLEQGTVPAEPLTRAETKTHLRVDVTDDDTLIDALIQGAREWAENYMRRSLVQRTLTLRLDCFPGELLLPRGPVISLTSLKYLDQSGALTDVGAAVYQSDLYANPARLMPAFGQVWPVPKYGTLNAVTAVYEAGYSPSSESPTDYAANIPAAIKAALKLHVQAHYGRGSEDFDVLMKAATSLLEPSVIRDYGLE